MYVQSWRASVVGIFKIPLQLFVQAKGRQLGRNPNNGLLVRDEILFGVLDRNTGELIGLSGGQNKPDVNKQQKSGDASEETFRYKFPSFSYFCVLFSSLLCCVFGFLFFGWGWGWHYGFYHNPQGRKGRIFATISCIFGFIWWWIFGAGIIFLVERN